MKKSKKEDHNYNYLKNLGVRTIISIILFLSLAIICKGNKEYKEVIYEKVYNTNFSFTKVKNIYDKYLGGVIPLDNLTTKIEPVFKEQLTYTDKSLYHDGVKLQVSNNYLVPALASGLVVYSGVKDNYGEVIIIEGIDGVDIWYGNLNTKAVNLYDYVEAGDLLGEVNQDSLYLVYMKDGKYLNYEDYLN